MHDTKQDFLFYEILYKLRKQSTVYSFCQSIKQTYIIFFFLYSFFFKKWPIVKQGKILYNRTELIYMVLSNWNIGYYERTKFVLICTICTKWTKYSYLCKKINLYRFCTDFVRSYSSNNQLYTVNQPTSCTKVQKFEYFIRRSVLRCYIFIVLYLYIRKELSVYLVGIFVKKTVIS